MCPDSGVARSRSAWLARSVGMFPSRPVRPCHSSPVSLYPTSPVSTPASPAAPSPGTDQYLDEIFSEIILYYFQYSNIDQPVTRQECRNVCNNIFWCKVKPSQKSQVILKILMFQVCTN